VILTCAMRRHLGLGMCGVALMLLVGCNEAKKKKPAAASTPVAKQDPAKKGTAADKSKTTPGKKDDTKAKDKKLEKKNDDAGWEGIATRSGGPSKQISTPMRDETRNFGGTGRDGNDDIPRHSFQSNMSMPASGESAFDRIEGEIKAAAGDRKTLVVYVCDQAASQMVGLLADRASRLLKGSGTPSAVQKNLSAAVVSFGDEVKIVTPEPVTDGAALAKAMNEVKGSSTPGKLAYKAVGTAAETFGKYRGQDYEVLFVVIADEAVSDEEALKAAVAKLKRDYIPVYAFGSPVPFYSNQQKATSGKPAGASWGIEHITVYTPARLNDNDYSDSGYGNFGLERIARMTDGKFFRARGSSNGWSADSTGDIKPDLIRKYAPEYISEADYKAKADENKARKALLEASKLVVDAQFEPPVMSFAGGTGDNQARLANQITMAQRKAAAPQQEFEKILTMLQAGESDRTKLGSPRWEASFDLALGRAYAAVARTLGYNKMLAQIKQGKAFADPSHNQWMLVSSPNFAGDSQLNTMAKKSREYLQRVVDNHPGTPWADIASKELTSECGWDWQEN
jgi:hypothetical protein